METSIERIHAKIAELEARIGDLRIAEREIQALDKISAPGTGFLLAPKPKPVVPTKPAGRPRTAGDAAPPQTIGAAITELLDRHGPLSATEIAEHIKATGRDINNRSVSFTLQALKKRGLAKTVGRKWLSGKSRSRRTPILAEASQDGEPLA
jgi:hypothetical protein